MRTPKPPEVRFWKHVQKSSSCWLWTGHKQNCNYGVIFTQRGNKLAHRLSYEINVGPIPEDRVVMHTCDNPPCVNPSHLRLGTRSDNAQDMVAKGRARKGLLYATS